MAQILLRNFNKTPLKYAMENIAGDVSMSVQSQSKSTAMQIADVSTSCPAFTKPLGRCNYWRFLPMWTHRSFSCGPTIPVMETHPW
jgi:hypothetical protein